MTANVQGADLAKDPWRDARIVWHMKSLEASEEYPLSLQVNGEVTVGARLEGDEYEQSLKRGGDGHVAVLNDNGWLSLDANRTNSLHTEGKDVTLYERVWLDADGNGSLFFSDFLGLSVHPTGLAIAYLGTETSEGKVYRELPLGSIDRGKWLDLVLRASGGQLDFFCNGSLIRTVPLHQELVSPFEEGMAIGAFLWGGPDLHVHPINSLHHGRIDTVALWDGALNDDGVAMLSAVDHVVAVKVDAPADRAISEYNAFFDASVAKDVTECGRLWNSMRQVTGQDPFRPVYHLTPPVGAIFDPVGAYYYDGRYHIFSYHNIHYLLKYCSLDHYVSDDLVHWTAWPLGPWADSDLDVYGIWLMNHFIDDQGIPSVIYTALGKQGKHGVMARSRDGLVAYTEKKAVLTKYHHDGHTWKDGDTWYTITTKMTKSTRPGALGDGIMLWSSPDLENWRECGEIFTQPKIESSTSNGDKAGFTEFPYLLSFGEKDVLMLGSHPVRYWVGKFDPTVPKFIPDKTAGQLLDYTNSFHCFNPMCVDQKGVDGSPRRIIMALFAGVNGEVDGLPWICAHAMPRALTLEGDHLRQDPLPEFEKLRGEHHALQNVRIDPEKTGYIDNRGDALEIIADFEPGDAQRFGLMVRVSEDRSSFVRIYFDARTREFGVDGNVPDTHGDLNLKPGQGAPTYLEPGQPVRMHVFLDKLMVEAFVNGQTCTTAAQDRDSRNIGLDLFSEGGAVLCRRLETWVMKSADSE